MRKKLSRITRVLLGAGISLAASSSFASLILVSPVAYTGTGIGAVNTVLTIQADPTETGSVSWNGTTDVITGDAKTGASQTLTRTLSELGVLSAADMRVVFNPVEPGGTANPITLTDLILRIYSPTGTTLFTSGVFSPVTFPNTETGTGRSGFMFRLDAIDAGQAQATAFTGAFGVNRVGLTATATSSSGGNETLFTVSQQNNIPEPATITTLLLGLGALVAMRKKSAT